jgi:hypothetical protein
MSPTAKKLLEFSRARRETLGITLTARWKMVDSGWNDYVEIEFPLPMVGWAFDML